MTNSSRKGAEPQRKRLINRQGPLSLVAFCSFVVKKVDRQLEIASGLNAAAHLGFVFKLSQ
jgi:hypothetical protein